MDILPTHLGALSEPLVTCLCAALVSWKALLPSHLIPPHPTVQRQTHTSVARAPATLTIASFVSPATTSPFLTSTHCDKVQTLQLHLVFYSPTCLTTYMTYRKTLKTSPLSHLLPHNTTTNPPPPLLLTDVVLCIASPQTGPLHLRTGQPTFWNHPRAHPNLNSKVWFWLFKAIRACGPLSLLSLCLSLSVCLFHSSLSHSLFRLLLLLSSSAYTPSPDWHPS